MAHKLESIFFRVGSFGGSRVEYVWHHVDRRFVTQSECGEAMPPFEEIDLASALLGDEWEECQKLLETAYQAWQDARIRSVETGKPGSKVIPPEIKPEANMSEQAARVLRGHNTYYGVLRYYGITGT
jgi:hypothetical protein